MRPQFCLQIGRNRKVDIGVLTCRQVANRPNIGQTNVTKTHLWKVGLIVIREQKKLEQVQNHGDWRTAHRAAAAFFLNLCNTGSTKALVSAGRTSACRVSRCHADFAKIPRSNIG